MHVVRRAIAFVMIGACGRVDFDPVGPVGDATSAMPLGPFGPATPLTPVNTSFDESDPTITGDGLELYFTSNRLGTADIFEATRASIGDPWGTATRVVEVSSPVSDSGVDVTPDGLVMFVGSDRTGALGGFDIWMSTRASRADAWSTPVNVTEISSTGHDNGATLSSTRLEVFFHSDRTSTNRNLWHAVRPDVGSAFGALASLAALNTPNYNGNPALSNADLSLWFNSDRPGGAGGQDLYLVERASAQDVAFGTPSPVVDVNSSADEEDPWVSQDGRWIVFTSTRSGNGDLWEAHR